MANPNLKPNQFILPCGAMITERPILFSTDMVHANLVERKTQTRRIVKDKLLQNNTDESIQEFLELTMKSCPYGEPGDLLWVRETWFKIDPDHGGDYAYKATLATESDKIRKDCIKAGRKYQWKPSIHMPKTASRIWLMVEEIRVERLHDISEDDAKAEGVIKGESIVEGYFRFRDYKSEFNTLKYAKSSFESLWASINGEDSWLSNPWVWVVKYRILSKTGKPSIETIEKNYLEITGKEVSNV